ncbi:hypothetical protein C0J52_17237 [Blattella germanica]|nr:hypothetical protein C0J52_17237 [Blattella germanica]
MSRVVTGDMDHGALGCAHDTVGHPHSTHSIEPLRNRSKLVAEHGGSASGQVKKQINRQTN